MKKVDTLRRLIREAVLAEMGDMWQHGRVGDTRMGVVVDMGTVDTIYFEGTPEACQAWIEENTEGAPEIVRGKNVILFKVWGDPASGRRDSWPSLNEMAVLAEMSIYDRYDNLRSSLPTRITGDPRWSIIEDWIEAERGVNSTTAAAAMKAWFEEVMGQVVDDIEVHFGGWVVLRGPGFPGGEIELDRDQLADMFYGRGAGPGLNEMRMPDMGVPSSDYHRTIEAWLQGEDISSRDFSRALETWFAVDKGMPDTRVSAIYFGGPIVLKGPGFEGGVLEMEIEDLEHAFGG